MQLRALGKAAGGKAQNRTWDSRVTPQRENEIEKSVPHKRTNRRGNTEGSQRVDAKDNKKEMSGKLKTNDMKGNNIPQTRGKKRKRQKQKIDTGSPFC